MFLFRKKKNSPIPPKVYELKDKHMGKVHKAAAAGDVVKLFHLALKNKNLNKPDRKNRTALHIASARGHVEAVEFLVSREVRLDLYDGEWKTPLMKAMECQQDDIVKILLQNDANQLMEDINGNTVLHLAVAIPALSTTKLLLLHNAEIDVRNKEGFSPLTVAVQIKNVGMAELLLQHNADVNATDHQKMTPLMMAAQNGQESMVMLLLQSGADVELLDSSKWSASKYAKMSKSNACLRLIREKKKSLLYCQEASQDEYNSLVQKLAEVEERCKTLEKELQQATRRLEEKDRLVESLKDEREQESEGHFAQAQTEIVSLRSRLKKTEGELTTATQILQETLSASAGSDSTNEKLRKALQSQKTQAEATTRQLEEKVKELQFQLENDASRCNQLEKQNRMMMVSLKVSSQNLVEQYRYNAEKRALQQSLRKSVVERSNKATIMAHTASFDTGSGWLWFPL